MPAMEVRVENVAIFAVCLQIAFEEQFFDGVS